MNLSYTYMLDIYGGNSHFESAHFQYALTGFYEKHKIVPTVIKVRQQDYHRTIPTFNFHAPVFLEEGKKYNICIPSLYGPIPIKIMTDEEEDIAFSEYQLNMHGTASSSMTYIKIQNEDLEREFENHILKGT